jgi:hypothetical protein
MIPRDVVSWREQALCAEVSGDLFFPDDEDMIPGRVTAALTVCGACAVSLECLSDALASGDNRFGIRAGLFPAERRALLRKRA